MATRDELYTLTTSLLDGEQIDSDLFDSLLKIAKVRRENERPWVILRKEDVSQSVAAGNTYLTAKTGPSDFRKWYGRFPIQLLNAAGVAVQYFREIPISRKLLEKDSNGKFYCDYTQIPPNIYLCGNIDQAYTIHQFYIRSTPAIAGSTEWVFPSDFHDVLAYDVAVYYKLGVDYDIVNNQQGNNNAAFAEAMMEAMREWDGALQEGMREGVDYGSDEPWRGAPVLPPDEEDVYG